MKNLKRALSLVLSAAMMVGMMVVGTSAASFKDVDATDNLEAIEVMKMIGVMEGVDEENFAPDRVVTRNEMAVVICNLMDLKLNGFHPFTDVPAWADDYVGAMYANELTKGTSATTYGGASNVTTVEAALMIMKTLGYFEYEVEFEGDWALATIKRATLLNLFEKIDAGVKEPLTRGEVAQMVLNALDEQLVIARDGSSNITVEGNGMNVNITDSDYGYNGVLNTDGSAKLLMDKLYEGKLVKTTGKQPDAFGRPSDVWTYTGNGETEKVVAPKAATTIWTASVTKEAMTKLLKDYAKSTINYYVDGKDLGTIAVDSIYTQTAPGCTVEMFTDAKTNTITDIVVINEYADKVYSVTKADEETGAERYVTVDGMKYETEDFAKKDRVVYTKAYDRTKNDGTYAIKSMKAAEFVEGKITGIVYNDKNVIKTVQIDGVDYKVNPTWFAETKIAEIKLNATVKMVVDTNGNLLWTDVAKAAAPSVDEYVVVLNKDGKDAFNAAQIKVLKADGTEAVVGFEQYTDKDNAANNSEATIANDTLYTMEDADNDGKFEFYAAKTTKASDDLYAGFDAVLTADTGLNAEKNVLVNGWEIADDAVVFAHKLADDGKTWKWSVTTGAKLATADQATVEFAYANEGSTGFMAVQLAVADSKIASSSDVVYGYVTADVMEVKNADNETVDKVTFWNGSETVTMLTDKANAGKLEKKMVFTYKVDGDGCITSVNFLTAAAVTGVNDTKIALADADKNAIGTYEIDDDVTVMYIDVEAVAGSVDGEIEIADKTDDEKNYILNVMFGLNAENKVIALIVDVLNDIQDKL